MAKFASFFTVAFLFSLLLSPSFAARPEPAFHDANLMKTQQDGIKAQQVEMEENCKGIGEEECTLMRRTLAAHLDYIYTQNHKP